MKPGIQCGYRCEAFPTSCRLTDRTKEEETHPRIECRSMEAAWLVRSRLFGEVAGPMLNIETGEVIDSTGMPTTKC